MKKIVYLPLDDRPCNYIYPDTLFDGNKFNIVYPSLDILGYKKTSRFSQDKRMAIKGNY